MIINPSHKITLSGLPPEILDAYVRYKKGTRAIVSWIVQFGPPERAGARSLPLKEMSRLATAAVDKLKELPEVIDFHFRETIAARKRLSKYFRGAIDSSPEDVDTVNHEHFTTSLTEIYESLCARCAKTKRRQESIRLAKEGFCSAEDKISNRFGHIALVEDADEDEDDTAGQGVVAQAAADSCSECRDLSPPSCPGPQKDIAFADDDLARRIQVSIIMQEISDHVEAVKGLWQQAACRSIHIITASMLTNVAFATISRLEASLRDVDESICLSELVAMCCTIPTESPDQAPQGLHTLIKRLQTMESAFGHYTEGHQSVKIVSCSTCMQRPADFVQSAPALGGQDDNSRLARALVDNLMHLLAAGAASPSIARNSSALYQDAMSYIARSDDDGSANKMKLALGLELLSQSYRAYLVNLDASTPPATCRLSALRLAQQAERSVKDAIVDKTSFPCQCPQTLAFHLSNLGGDLNGYARYRCWDLYFQSPWIAGNHMLEMLDLGHYYGEKLFAYRHYVGSVLHSYNVLQQLAGLDRIPLLEFLCQHFEGVFFPGGRPTGNFRACWTRYIGARLRFNKGHRTRNQRDSWCMAIPAHAARRAAGLGVVGQEADQGDKDDCLLFRIKHQEYKVSDAQWEAVTSSSSSSSTEAANPASRLRALAAVIDKEVRNTDGGIAPAAINPFAVFGSCVKVIKTLSDDTHTDAREKGMNCICFVTAILQGAERMTNARKLGRTVGAAWTKEEREGVVDVTKAALANEFAVLREGNAAAVDKWVWDV